MKRLFILLAVVLFSCQPNDKAEQEVVADNKELQQMYDEDQGDRQGKGVDWSKISERDRQREARVYEMLDSNLVVTAQDYRNAAMIFQHGMDTVASGMAVKMMRKAVELDPNINKWLLAAAIDRDLMRRDEPQIYGTQYTRKRGEPWKLYEIDTTQITDEERQAYGVETLAEQRQKVKLMNKKRLIKFLVEGNTIDELIAFCKKENLETSEYNISESEINMLGYQLMNDNKMEEALKVFEMNTELYPDAYNTFDSYGECLMKMGKKEEAVEAYNKSLELNQGNENAREMLAKMES